ncbi:MAG TPA: CAP domain-containing protein, partial [Anaeromyxobacter sp.]
EGGGAAPRGDFAPSVAPTPAYGANVGRCPTGGAFEQVMDELAGAARRAGREPVKPDAPLCAIAESFLRYDGPMPPRPQVLAFVSQWFGLTTQIVPPSIAVIESEDKGIIAERIVQAVGNSVLNALHPRLGLATQKAGRDATKVVVVLVEAPIEINPPFPKRLDLGQKATLSGRLLAGLKSPKVQVSDPSGQLLAPEQAPGDAFRVEIACGDRPGRILVDVRGEVDGRPGLVASFPVACGADLPRSISLAPEPWPTDPAEAEKKILELVNRERTSAGLAALKWDPGVAGVARSISEDIATRGASAGGDVAERLKREGIASHLVLQSAASDRSFERAHDRLMSSPSNRANIMSREVTSVGIGAVSKPEADGKPMTYVTEVFTKELAPVDLSKTRQDLKSAVAQKRKDARMGPLTVEPLLDEVAQKYADALAAAAGSLPKEKQSEITAPLNKTMRTLTILSGAKPDPLDFAEEPQVTAVAKAVGVGVAQGKHAVLGRNAVYVAIMVGTLRSDAEPKPAAVKGSRKASGAKQPR